MPLTCAPCIVQMPIPVSAIAASLSASFPTPAEVEHEYYLTARGANSSCTFRPAVIPNQLDYRGVEIQLNDDPRKVSRAESGKAKRQAGGR